MCAAECESVCQMQGGNEGGRITEGGGLGVECLPL